MVTAVPLQVPNPFSSLVSVVELLSYYDSRISGAFFVGIVLPSAWSSIDGDAI